MMRFEIPVGAELILSSGEHGFSDVIEAMPEAGRIYVATYGALGKDGDLFQYLHESKAARCDVVCKIPGRKDDPYWYGKGDERKKAREMFSRYFKRLDPAKFPGESEVYFSLGNHSKVVATDTIAYFGSANFTLASARNEEIGCVVRDPERKWLPRVLRQIFESLAADAIRYRGGQISQLEVMATGLLNQLEQHFEAWQQAFFEPAHLETYDRFVPVMVAALSQADLEDILGLVGELEALMEVLGEEGIEDMLDLSPLWKLEEIACSDPIQRVAVSLEDLASEIYSDEFAMEEDGVERASERAFEVLAERTQEAHEAGTEYLRIARKTYDYLEDALPKVLGRLQELEAARKKEIDNT